MEHKILAPNNFVKFNPGDGTVGQIATVLLQVDTDKNLVIQYDIAMGENSGIVFIEQLEPQEPVEWMHLVSHRKLLSPSG